MSQQRPPRSLYDLLSSKGLAVIMFGLIAAFTALGTFIIQFGSPEEYVAVYGRLFTRLIFATGANDLFHTLYFEGVLVLFAFNLFLCTLKRKFSLPKLGFFMVHLGMIVVMIGAAVGLVFGHRGMVWLDTGEQSARYLARAQTGEYPVELPFSVRLDEFDIHYKEHPERVLYVLVPGKTEMEQAALFAIEDGASEKIPSLGLNFAMQILPPPATTEIEATGSDKLMVGGDPHSSSQFDLDLDQLPNPVITLGDNMTVQPLKYIPHAMVDGEGHVYKQSDNPINPALEVEIRFEDQVEKRWLFAKFPGFGHKEVLEDLTIAFVKGSESSEPVERLKLTVTDDRGAEATEILPLTLDEQSSARFKTVTVVAQSSMAVDSYKSLVSVIDGDQEVARQFIEVNHPLVYKGLRFYQSSYRANSIGENTITGIEVVDDPGLWLVYLGFISMLIGVIWIFWLEQLIRRWARK
jgi:ResB-like family